MNACAWQLTALKEDCDEFLADEPDNAYFVQLLADTNARLERHAPRAALPSPQLLPEITRPAMLQEKAMASPAGRSLSQSRWSHRKDEEDLVKSDKAMSNWWVDRQNESRMRNLATTVDAEVKPKAGGLRSSSFKLQRFNAIDGQFAGNTPAVADKGNGDKHKMLLRPSEVSPAPRPGMKLQRFATVDRTGA